MTTQADSTSLFRDIHEALGLPGTAYGEHAFQAERQKLFPENWVAIGVGAAIPDPGDALPIDLAGTPLVAIRQTDRTIAVFVNICRHRGMQVVTEPRRGANLFTCAWHAWCYGRDGKLERTPRISGNSDHHQPGLNAEQNALVSVRTALWRDLILVNLSGQAPPFDALIDPLDAFLTGLPRELRYDGNWVGAYPGNWKIAIEGAVEDYHLPYAHPQLMEGVRSRHVTVTTGECFAAMSAGVELTQSSLTKGILPRLVDHPKHTDLIHIINLFPTGILAVTGSHMLVGTFLPDGATKTRLEINLYWPREAFGSPELDKERARALDKWIELIGQDSQFVDSVQRAAAARDAFGIRTRFSPYWEGAVLHFQRMVAKAMS
jgi:choline monooxygenase